MGKRFWNNVKVTLPFFGVRLMFAFVISVVYIFVAAAIQYAFVLIFGETAYNYIVGGIMSLFLGILFCHYIGALLFMLVKGWHVAALAYVPKIVKTNAPVVNVGIRAFNRNFISFGIIYGVRNILKSVLFEFTDEIWNLTDDIPYGNVLKNVAQNPIVEHIAKDILHYGFDATIFYLVRHPAKDMDDIPSTVMTAVKRYLYCLPTILVSSVSSYILFRVVPAVLKWVAILYALFTQGVVAGILIMVLMYPVFYIVDNALLDPLTMILFLTAYGRRCDDELSEDNPIVSAVNDIINGTKVGTSSKDFEDEIEEDDEDESGDLESEYGTEIEPDDEEDETLLQSAVVESTDEFSFMKDINSEPPLVANKSSGISGSSLRDLADIFGKSPKDDVVDYRIAGSPAENFPLEDGGIQAIVENDEEDYLRPESNAIPDDDEDVNPIDLFDIFKGFKFSDLDVGYDDKGNEVNKPHDRAQSILLGDEDE